MTKHLNVLFSSFLAGACIGIGVIVYLSLITTAKIVGSLFFGLGLYTIIGFGLWLYTGKVGFILDNKPSYFIDLLICLVGNFLGIGLITGIMRLTRVSEVLITNASALVEAKQNDSWYSILVLSFMCGIMIYIAVKGHQKIDNPIGKLIIVFLAVSVFILSGFEHCIANAGYYVLSGTFDLTSLLYFIIMIIGNGLGSVFFDGLLKIIAKQIK